MSDWSALMHDLQSANSIGLRTFKMPSGREIDVRTSIVAGKTVYVDELAAPSIVESRRGPPRDNAAELNASTEEPTKPKDDPINPKHYKGDLVMRIIELFELDFTTGNVVKYLLRHGNKAGLEDLKKGRWYLERRISQLEGTLGEPLK